MRASSVPRIWGSSAEKQRINSAQWIMLSDGRPAKIDAAFAHELGYTNVTTPAGCTIAGILAMEDGRIRSVLARGIETAARAAGELGK